MIKKILFLDIDWVLNIVDRENPKMSFLSDWMPSFSDKCIQNLNYVFENTPWLEIVVTSTWRKWRTIKELQSIFKTRWFNFSNRIIDKTPNLTTDYKVLIQRGDEIKEWLLLNMPYETVSFIIVDDDSDMLEDQMKNFIQTTIFEWLSREKADLIIKLFSIWT